MRFCAINDSRSQNARHVVPLRSAAAVIQISSVFVSLLCVWAKSRVTNHGMLSWRKIRQLIHIHLWLDVEFLNLSDDDFMVVGDIYGQTDGRTDV